MHCVTVYGEVLWGTEEPIIGESEDHKVLGRGGAPNKFLEPLALDVAGAIYKYTTYLDIFCICLKIGLFRLGQLLFNWIPC
jgi:hypothetical protein